MVGKSSKQISHMATSITMAKKKSKILPAKKSIFTYVVFQSPIIPIPSPPTNGIREITRGLPEINCSPLKMMVSNRNLLFQGAPIFRGYVSFREGNQPPVYPLRPSFGSGQLDRSNTSFLCSVFSKELPWLGQSRDIPGTSKHMGIWLILFMVQKSG